MINAHLDNRGSSDDFHKFRNLYEKAIKKESEII